MIHSTGRCHQYGPCWIFLVFKHRFITACLLLSTPPTHTHQQPPHPSTPLTCRVFTPASRATSSLPLNPTSTPCWQLGQGRWPTLSVKEPTPRSNITDTNYCTAGARPGNRMETTWSNQGTQQQGQKMAKKSEQCYFLLYLATCLWRERERESLCQMGKKKKIMPAVVHKRQIVTVCF